MPLLTVVRETMKTICKPNSELDRQRPPNTGGEDSNAQQGGKVEV